MSVVHSSEYQLSFNPVPNGRFHFTDSELAGRLDRAEVFTLPLILHGKHTPGDTRCWFAREADRRAFTKVWQDLRYQVTVGE
jgi:hypothetical protein